MLPNDKLASWNDFAARRAAKDAAAGAPPPAPGIAFTITANPRPSPATDATAKAAKPAKPAAPRRERKTPPPAPPATVTVADLLAVAVHAAVSRRGRIARATIVREQTLLEVLTEALRKAAA